MIKKYFTVFMACSMLNLSLFAATPLERGTSLSVRITSTIQSNANKTTPTAIVENDVKSSDGKILIKRGTPVELQVKTQKARGCGKAGFVETSCISTTSIDGQSIILGGGTATDEGENKKGAAIGCGVGLGLTFLPFIGFAFLAIKGGKATIPANTIINNVYVANDYTIE